MNKQLMALKMIYQSIFRYLENDQSNVDQFQDLYNVLCENEIFQEKNKFKLILYLISSIANNHKRIANNLFPRIEKILQSIKNEIQNSFSNDQIFNIFQSNKKILLFLFKEKIITPNKYIFSIITEYKNDAINNYPSFFYPEFKSFFTSDSNIKTQFYKIDPKEFDEKRQIGENDSYISYLIRNDLIDEFIIYISKSNYSLSNNINSSIFETNKFLIDKNPTLIEYACFFGSIRIFKYLQLNGITLTQSLCQYAIHSNNAELISLLEEKHLSFSNNYECLLESIKCHHNEITDYLLLNYFNGNESKSYVLEQSIKYYNFSHISNEIYNNSDAFYYLCKKDYYLIVKLLMNSSLNSLNINKQHEKMLENKKDGFEIKLKDLEYFENRQFKKRYRELKTPLIAAIFKRNYKMIEILLQHKNINVNIKFDSFFSICYNENITYIHGGEYKSILFIAAEKGYSEIVQLLINRKDININEINRIYDGFILKELTALHISILNENIEIINILLKSKNIDPNAFGTDSESGYVFYKRSPLVMAIEKGNSPIVRLLLSKKETDPNIGYHHYVTNEVDDGQDFDETVEYSNSLKIAQKSGNKEIIQIIMNHLGVGEASEICQNIII